MVAPLVGIMRSFEEGPAGYVVLSGDLEFPVDAVQGDDIWTIQPIGGSGHRYLLTTGSGTYQLAATSGATMTLQRGPGGSPAAGVPEAFEVLIVDRWGKTFPIAKSCNVLSSGPADVDPQIGDATFSINTAYENDDVVGTVPLLNDPTGTPTYAITDGNTGTAFAIDATTPTSSTQAA